MGWGQMGVPGERQKYTDLSIHQLPLRGPIPPPCRCPWYLGGICRSGAYALRRDRNWDECPGVLSVEGEGQTEGAGRTSWRSDLGQRSRGQRQWVLESRGSVAITRRRSGGGQDAGWAAGKGVARVPCPKGPRYSVSPS